MSPEEIESKLAKEKPDYTMADLLRVLPEEHKIKLYNALKGIAINKLRKDHNNGIQNI